MYRIFFSSLLPQLQTSEWMKETLKGYNTKFTQHNIYLYQIYEDLDSHIKTTAGKNISLTNIEILPPRTQLTQQMKPFHHFDAPVVIFSKCVKSRRSASKPDTDTVVRRPRPKYNAAGRSNMRDLNMHIDTTSKADHL